MSTGTYLFKEGYNNLRKHSSKTFSTMLIICATMLVLGIFIVLFQKKNANGQTEKISGKKKIASSIGTDTGFRRVMKKSGTVAEDTYNYIKSFR